MNKNMKVSRRRLLSLLALTGLYPGLARAENKVRYCDRKSQQVGDWHTSIRLYDDAVFWNISQGAIGGDGSLKFSSNREGLLLSPPTSASTTFMEIHLPLTQLNNVTSPVFYDLYADNEAVSLGEKLFSDKLEVAINTVISPSAIARILNSQNLKLRFHDGNKQTYLQLSIPSPQVSARSLDEMILSELAAFRRGECQIAPADCVLTTACCDMLGLADDCWELRTLRIFRDSWLRAQSFGEVEINQYYQLASQTLASLNSLKDASHYLTRLYWCFILPSALLACVGANRLAYQLYKRGVLKGMQDLNKAI